MPTTSDPGTVAPSGAGRHPLWALLTAVSGVTDQLERARLTATALPALFSCELGGVALFAEDASAWSLVLHREGVPFSMAHTKQILSTLEPVFQKAFENPPVFVLPADSGPASTQVQDLGVDSLFLTPMMTVQRRLGVLIAGKTGRQALSRDEELALATLAEHSAIGIEKLRLHEALQKYSEELQRRNELILDAAGEGIYGLNAEGRTTFVNPAAAKMLGWHPADLIGEPMHEFHHHSKPWPGNIRELENIIERAAIITTDPILEGEESLPTASSASAGSAGSETLADVERAHVLAVLDKVDWTISGKRGAAAILGINPSTLRSRMAKLGIKRPGPAR